MPIFRKIIYSGICLCGHSYEEHHLGVVANPEAAAVIGDYLPQECEFFGFNENGGLDENGNEHCRHYVDTEDPDSVHRSQWQGTRR
jgi:hypothetical protein